MSLAKSKQLLPDYNNIWYPCSQMKDYESFIPLEVKSASGSYIELTNGKKIIDAISSWWCKSLGHNHPKIKEALFEQANAFEHVLMPNIQNKVLNQLSQKLSKLMPHLTKVFYAGDGSCAVEIALKMCVHARVLKGENQRNKFIALKNGYHGETSGCMSVSDLGLYKAPYESMLFDCEFVDNIPYVSGEDDPLWQDCSSYWTTIEKQLEPLKYSANALILEPIIQAAGGMKIYSKDFLQRISTWCNKNDVYLIYDEIMTGFGRTGKMLACEYAENPLPDFICLSKGLTSGWMPFSAVLTHQKMYDLFYDDYQTGKAFLHSHTYCGNPLAAAVALSVVGVMEDEGTLAYVTTSLQAHLLSKMQDIAQKTGRLENIRSIGGMIAADLIVKNKTDKRYGFELYKIASSLGILLRPLGNTIYWAPPLNTALSTIDELSDITKKAIDSLNLD